jgi:hypothetical protein
VHVLGDLEDVKNLVKGVNKKKTVVIFRDGDTGLLYTDIEGDIQQVPVELISNLEKDYRFIYFDFFPGRKREEVKSAVVSQTTEEDSPAAPDESKTSGKKKVDKVKKEKKTPHTQKEKKDPKRKKTPASKR